MSFAIKPWSGFSFRVLREVPDWINSLNYLEIAVKKPSLFISTCIIVAAISQMIIQIDSQVLAVESIVSAALVLFEHSHVVDELL